MAAKPHSKSIEAKKRKRTSNHKSEQQPANNKKPKLAFDSKKHKQSSSNVQNKVSKKHFKPPANDKQSQGFKKDEGEDTKKLRRLRAKELAEARKKKRKKHFSLEQELALLWEKMRCRNIAKEERSRLVSEALQKMTGKMSEIASSHVSSRVLQTCVKHCTQDERNVVFTELRPHLIALANNTYAVHLVIKMLDNASKEQIAEVISSLHGHVASLLRHMVGSLVIEHAYNLGNATQKQALLMELYSPELQLFKDLVTMKESRLEDVITKLQLQKSSVLRHMFSVLQPILEKGILDHSIVHRALMEYLSIADQSSAADIIQQLSGPLIVRMIHTKDGSRLGMLSIRHGGAKERKKIIKGMKGHVNKICHDKFGTMVLVCIFSVVDDTKLISKTILRELESNLKELLLDQNGRRPFLQLLHPNCQRYFSPDDLTSLSMSIPSLKSKEQSDSSEVCEEDKNVEGDHPDISAQINEGGKKDSSKRRHELLVDSGLAEELVDACCEMTESLLRSKYGKEIIYEIATGGADGILHPTLDEKLSELYKSIASLAAQPKMDEPDVEHILEHFHSSRVIRKLVLDCPSFASTLWEKALKGKCAIWAKGHSSKVINAFLETSNSKIKEMANEELKPLVENGDLSPPNESAKND
ncbi:pumilio homolog 24 isoform X2 [Andrographis paniculata]|uniref:pumilio homolog 24 isoform X2 n=1 Tax=Andrographis paniculata TaxID=175694 RepID=UPI0021E92D17|nr:pumilio homolog 24 isoform X2 [Andrographis paniculata]